MASVINVQLLCIALLHVIVVKSSLVIKVDNRTERGLCDLCNTKSHLQKCDDWKSDYIQHVTTKDPSTDKCLTTPDNTSLFESFFYERCNYDANTYNKKLDISYEVDNATDKFTVYFPICTKAVQMKLTFYGCNTEISRLVTYNVTSEDGNNCTIGRVSFFIVQSDIYCLKVEPILQVTEDATEVTEVIVFKSINISLFNSVEYKPEVRLDQKGNTGSELQLGVDDLSWNDIPLGEWHVYLIREKPCNNSYCCVEERQCKQNKLKKIYSIFNCARTQTVDCKQDEMIFYFTNLTEGTYNVLIKSVDYDCMLGDDRRFNSSKSVKLTNTRNVTETVTDSGEWIIFVSIIVAMVVFIMLVCVASCLYIRLCREKIFLREDEELQPSFNNTAEKVLLLYCNENPAFVDVMTKLRQLLSQYVTVYDCYDVDIQENIAVDPPQWLDKLITDMNVRIIIVNSKYAQQYFNGNAVPFVSHPFNFLFKRGLRYLSENDLLVNYNRVFVVFIEDYIAQLQELELVVNFRRYVIPHHLNNLLNALCNVELHYNDDNYSAVIDSILRLRDAQE